MAANSRAGPLLGRQARVLPLRQAGDRRDPYPPGRIMITQWRADLCDGFLPVFTAQKATLRPFCYYYRQVARQMMFGLTVWQASKAVKRAVGLVFRPVEAAFKPFCEYYEKRPRKACCQEVPGSPRA